LAFFSGLTTGIYRETRDGRRVFGVGRLLRMPKAWYLVSDDAVPGFEKRFRQYFAAFFFAVIPVGGFLAGFNPWIIFTIALVWPWLAMRFWVLVGLPRTEVREDELVPIDRRARYLAQLQAMGEPIFWVQLVGTSAMASLAVYILRTDGDRWAWIGIAMFGGFVIWSAMQILSIRRARRS
jgi:hypothetical protein